MKCRVEQGQLKTIQHDMVIRSYVVQHGFDEGRGIDTLKNFLESNDQLTNFFFVS